MKILGITSCPTGVAHTYMAAEQLEKAGRELGIEVKVETHGSIGVENAFTDEDLREADGVVLAVDVEVPTDRFEGMPTVHTSVREAIDRPHELLQRISSGEEGTRERSDAGRLDAGVGAGDADAAGRSADERGRRVATAKERGRRNPVYGSLMNGVSHMIPFVVVGGLLIALSLGLGGEPTPDGLAIPEGSPWARVLAVGEAGFFFLVPILAAYIAVAIADRPGLAPGAIGGFIAADGSFYGSPDASAGFLGGIVAGFIAGYAAKALKSVPVPRALQPVMPILVIPLVATLVVAVLFIFVIGAPIAGLFTALTDALQGLQEGSAVVLALVLGAMIAFDMGGPVNKVAFLFGAALIGEGQTFVMGAIAAAICTPPLGMGLATLLRRDAYTPDEQTAGKAALAMGLVGITEGAIPLAAADPLRVIPSIMAGSMVASAVAMLGGVTDSVPHGGPIVAVFQAIGNVGMFFVAILAGTAVTALLANLLKGRQHPTPA